MLDSKLRFVESAQTASKCFRAEMDKIERHEVPYDTFDPENGDRPADIGKSDSVTRLRGAPRILAVSTDQLGLGQPPKIKGKGIFQRYCQLILQKTGLDIAKLGADCALIEEIFLARNLIQHGGDIGTKLV